MPIIQVTLLEGYSETAKQQLCKNLTSAVLNTIDANPDGVIVAITECHPSGYMRGGQPRTPGAEKTERHSD